MEVEEAVEPEHVIMNEQEMRRFEAMDTEHSGSLSRREVLCYVHLSDL